MEEINNRILKEICFKTINDLKDINLLNEYKNCNSVKNKIYKLEKILEKNKINNKEIDVIINDYYYELIPAGTKGVIRGNKFNRIVKKIIEDLNLNENEFEVCFEKKCEYFPTNEIPDWFIFQKKTKKVIIGMNQLDLWNGGHQLNRGFKYINQKQCENFKFLCVVCNKIQFKKKNKVFTLFEIGFNNNTLCYLNNLENIIFDYFDKKKTILN